MNYNPSVKWAEQLADKYNGELSAYMGNTNVWIPRTTSVAKFATEIGCPVRIAFDRYRSADKTRAIRIEIHGDYWVVYPFDYSDPESVDMPKRYTARSDAARALKTTFPDLDIDLSENLYEQLNKINDEESLSEKYNVKNVKELKKLQES